MPGATAPWVPLAGPAGADLDLLRSLVLEPMILFEMLDALPLDALGAAIAGAVSAEGALVLDLDAGDVATTRC